MTIHRIGNPEATLSGVHCIQCEAVKKKMKPRARESGTTRIVRMTLQLAEDTERLRNYVPFDILIGQETGREEANALAEGHDKLHPRHHIVVWSFDKNHPLSDAQVRELAKTGVTRDAASFGARK